jgi:glycosyltransferase involved in cell wall biosynthesis
VNKTIAYLAGTFPLVSETFVYREVRELRRRGWNIVATSLNEPPKNDSLSDLRQDLIVVYEKGWIATALAEVFSHPILALITWSCAKWDMCFPGEPTSLRERVKLLGQSLAGMSLAHRLRGRGVQHIHCHFAHAPTSVGMYAARQLGVTFSFTGHANDLFQRRTLLRRKLRRAAFVSCISRWHQDFYRQIEADPSGKYDVIRCGVDVSQWSMNRIEPHDPLRLLTVCRLVEKKGVDVLIRALASVNRSVRLIVAGDGEQREQLHQLADELKCADRIEWLGAVDNERVRSLMKDADVFALPCKTDSKGDRDGVPVVLMEAMARGLTVISGDLPAIHELIEPGVDGLLVGENDDAKLVALIENLSYEQRCAFAKAARKKVEGEYSLTMNVDRLEKLLEGVGKDEWGGGSSRHLEL